MKLIFKLHKFDRKQADQINSSYYLKTPTYENLLTNREQEILFFCLRLKTAKEIAKVLAISYRTVQSHLENIKIKLGCYSQRQLHEYAIHSGLIQILPQNLIKMINLLD